jgi:hypothetical protein
VKVTNGGAAGKGPEPPEPPAMSVDGSSEYPNMAEELDAGEIEGKTKMAFAKMQVPQSVKDSHLLSDTDFMLNADRESEENTADQSSTGAASLSGDEAEAQEALEHQMVAHSEANGSNGSHGSRAGTPGGGRVERGPSFRDKMQRSRGNSFRSSTMSRSNSAVNSPRQASNVSSAHGVPEPSPSPEPAAHPAKRADKAAARKNQHGGASSTAGVTLKPLHPPKHHEPSMAEQAARLGLFTKNVN